MALDLHELKFQRWNQTGQVLICVSLLRTVRERCKRRTENFSVKRNAEISNLERLPPVIVGRIDDMQKIAFPERDA